MGNQEPEQLLEGTGVMTKKLAELLAELDERRKESSFAVALKHAEYDLLREALHEREGMMLVPRADIEDLLHAISTLFAVTERGDCLAERKPTKDESAYNAFAYLNAQVARVRAMLTAAEGK